MAAGENRAWTNKNGEASGGQDAAITLKQHSPSARERLEPRLAAQRTARFDFVLKLEMGVVSIWREGGLDESIGRCCCDVTSHLLFFLSLSVSLFSVVSFSLGEGESLHLLFFHLLSFFFLFCRSSVLFCYSFSYSHCSIFYSVTRFLLSLYTAPLAAPVLRLLRSGFLYFPQPGIMRVRPGSCLST